MKTWMLIWIWSLCAGASRAADYNPNNFMLRWTPLQWTNFVRHTAGTNSSSGTNVDLRPYQYGSTNLTNWSKIPTNVLEGLVRQTNLVAQTNTLWERVTNGTQNLEFTWSATDVYATNVLWSYTPASDTVLRFDFVDLFYYDPLGGGPEVTYINFLGYTLPGGQATWRNIYGGFDDYSSSVPNNLFVDNLTVSNHVTSVSRSFLVAAQAGSPVILSNWYYNSINSAPEPRGTNYFKWTVSEERQLVTLRWAN